TVSGRQNVYALFAETLIPFHDFAALQLAVRREAYGGGVGDTVDPKIFLEIRPVSWLSFPSSYSTSFQAPTMRQTASTANTSVLGDYGVPGTGPNSAVCAQSGVTGASSDVVVNTRGSEGLKPQSARNFSIGLTARPVEPMQLGVDFWNYDYRDLITPSE